MVNRHRRHEGPLCRGSPLPSRPVEALFNLGSRRIDADSSIVELDGVRGPHGPDMAPTGLDEVGVSAGGRHRCSEGVGLPIDSVGACWCGEGVGCCRCVEQPDLSVVVEGLRVAGRIGEHCREGGQPGSDEDDRDGEGVLAEIVQGNVEGREILGRCFLEFIDGQQEDRVGPI